MGDCPVIPVGTARALVLFGSPGSGKGTQARLLRERYQVPHISTGDMLRDHIQSGDTLGNQVVALMKSGQLVSDELANALVRERTSNPDCIRGFILDGYPRTIPQAQYLGRLLGERGVAQVVIHLKVDYNGVIARMTGRRQCPVCGTLYNLSSKPPQVVERCDLDGAPLSVRDDDREEVIRQRLEAYEAQTRPVLGYFRDAGHPVCEVEGDDAPPAVVLARVRALIDKE